MSLRPYIPQTQYRGHVQTVAPAVEPVTPAELNAHLADTLSDSEANGWITAARQLIEDYTGLAMINQTWRLALDHWPGGREPWWDGVRQGAISELYANSKDRSVYLPRYPLGSVSSVTVYDEAGNSAAVDVGATFDLDTYQRPGRLTLKRGATWPIALRANNAIEIVYVSGFGASAANVPAPLKLAVKSVAGYLIAHRGDGCEPTMAMASAASLVAPYRVARI